MRLLPLLLIALPLPALAEGARLTLDCSFVTACDEAGTCAPGDGPVRFMVEPEDIDGEGLGLYSLWTDDGPAELARGASRTGPFAWAPGESIRMTLALTGEASALWIRQTIGNGGETPSGAEIDLMNCEVTY